MSLRNEREYWQKRAVVYNNLEWVKDQQFMDAIISLGDFDTDDVVLDLGTGTGLVAEAVSPLVKKVVALDSSPHMLSLVVGNHSDIDWVIGDARHLDFYANTFDKITARYVFHHIVHGTERAMAECYRVLKPGGTMVFAEGVPPSQRTKKDFIEILKLKEERLTFMPEDMERLMQSAGFKIRCRTGIWLRRMSIRNWVESSGISKQIQDTILRMHTSAPQYFKDDYQMTESKDDCLIDMKVEIMAGVKC